LYTRSQRPCAKLAVPPFRSALPPHSPFPSHYTTISFSLHHAVRNLPENQSRWTDPPRRNSSNRYFQRYKASCQLRGPRIRFEGWMRPLQRNREMHTQSNHAANRAKTPFASFNHAEIATQRACEPGISRRVQAVGFLPRKDNRRIGSLCSSRYRHHVTDWTITFW